MSSAALLCDTSALLDYLVLGAPDHAAFREAIDRARTRYVPGLVLSEVDYFLRDERRAMGAFMRDLSAAPSRTQPRPRGSWRALDIDRRYSGLGLGLVDSSIIALAEELRIYQLATRDIRHFSAVELRGGRRFELVVYPRRPDLGP